MPKSNIIYLAGKVDINLQRDRENVYEPEKLGWRVFAFWESQIENNLDRLIGNLKGFFQQT